jgi:hypothetical protein
MIRLDAELLKKTGVFALVSGELTISIGGGYWLGNLLDERLHTKPAFSAGLAILGLVYAVWRIFGLAKSWSKTTEK